MTTQVEKSIQVDVPIDTVYNQWTQFAEFPQFMGGVKEVRTLGDDRLHWVAEIAGVKREWEARVLEQVPDQKVAWAATSGATNAGAVRFEPLGPSSTMVHLSLEYEPEGIVEAAGDKLGIVGKQAQSDLEKFKSFIEDAGYATGAWRGGVNEGAGVGTPGVEHAAASQGDSGKPESESSGPSAKQVVAGVAAAAVGVAAATAIAGKVKGDDEPEVTPVEPVSVTPVATTPADTTTAMSTTTGADVGSVVPENDGLLNPGLPDADLDRDGDGLRERGL